MRLLRAAPLLQFLFLGLLLLALQLARREYLSHGTDAGSDATMLYRAAVTLGIDREAAAVRDRLIRLGRFLDLDSGAAPQEVEQRAREVGLVENDPVIRRHLEHLAELALQRGGASVLPSEAQVAEHYAAEDARYVAPARMRFAHIYFSSARRGPGAEAAARAALDRLRSEPGSAAAVASSGDPFVRGLSAGSTTHADLERALGPELARAVDTVPEQTWSGPLRSPYGFHLVWVGQRRPAQKRSLASVRNQVVHRLARERGALLAARRLELLRQTAARPAP